MHVNKAVKASFAILVSAGALVACNKLQWMVKYQDQDPYYSFSSITTADAQGNAFIGGYIENRPEAGGGRIPFVAKYDSSGHLIWDKRFDVNDHGGTTMRGINGLLVDAQGNLYLAEPRLNEDHTGVGLLITKLNAAGEQVWQWYGADTNLYDWKLSMNSDNEGNIYVRAGWFGGGRLLSLSPGGEFRWDEPVQAPAGIGGGDDRGLEPYVPMVQSAVNDADFDWVMSSSGLRIVDLEANTLAEFTLAALGLSSIAKAEIVNDNLIVFGATSDNKFVARLIRKTSAGFVLDSEKWLDVTSVLPTSSLHAISQLGDQGVCFASRTGDSTLNTGFIDAELNLVWTHARIASKYEYPPEVVTVIGTNNACYTQYYESQAEEELVSVVLVENATTGKELERISQADFAPHDLAVSGKAVYQVGITGPYSDTEGTAATLFKHLIY